MLITTEIVRNYGGLCPTKQIKHDKLEFLQIVKEFRKFVTDKHHLDSLILFSSFFWTCSELGPATSLSQR